ncbi:hypothetical protein FRC07_007798, partial [Ceratobasidium sp. 392]
MGSTLSAAIDSGPYMGLEPGTYRITHVASKTVIRFPDQDQLAECIPELKRKHHTWFIERDDEGYIFKNCKFGTYLGMSESDSSFACPTSRPQTWKIYSLSTVDTYLLQPAGRTGLLEHSDEKGPDGGTLLGLCSQWSIFRHEGWRLDLINVQHGTDALAREILDYKQELLGAYRELSACQSALLQRDVRIQNMNQELGQKDVEIESLK